MNKFTKVNSQDGLTLLEVLIAMVILSIALLLLLNMGMVALDGNDWSNRTTVAAQRMQQKLEQIRGSNSFSDGEETVDDVTLKWSVSNLDAHLRRVDITATWQDIGNRQVSNAMTAYIKSDSV